MAHLPLGPGRCLLAVAKVPLFFRQLELAADLAECAAAEIVLLAVPMQQLGGFLSALPQKKSPKYLVSCCKGIDLETGKGASALLQAQAPNAQAAVLTGPSFATDLAAGSPTALSLACADAAAGLYLQVQLSTPSLRLYRSTDVIGALAFDFGDIGVLLKDLFYLG